MLVLCDECKNHYEDTAQSSECAGIGVTASSVTGVASSHSAIGSTPIADHIAAMRALRRGRRTR